jgi:hypothetical protein
MKIIKFILRYITKHPVYLFAYVIFYLAPNFRQKIYFYEKSQVKQILDSGKSIIRLGDGEVYILLDTAMAFHAANRQLKNKLKKIIKTYKKDSGYVLALPKQIQESNSDLKKDNLKTTWLPFKVMYFLFFPKKVKYVDAHMFYPDFDKTTFKNEVMPFLRKKSLVFITKKKTIDKIKNGTLFNNKDAAYVTTPEHNAFDSYDEIKNEVAVACKKLATTSEIVLLFALGPAGKVMAFEYSEQGYQSIDVGHGFDFMFS